MGTLVNAAGARYLAVFAGAAVLAAVIGTVRVGPSAAVLVGTVLWIGALVGVALVPWPESGLRIGVLAGAWLVTALLLFLTPALLWAGVLGVRGERVEATVVGIEGATDRNRHLYYHLADAAAAPIPGVLGRWPGGAEGAVGDRVTVVRDPGGLVDPRLPAEVQESHAYWVFAPILLAALAWLCGIAGRPRRSFHHAPDQPPATAPDPPRSARPSRRRRRPGRPPK